jgi:hypothetical protein
MGRCCEACVLCRENPRAPRWGREGSTREGYREGSTSYRGLPLLATPLQHAALPTLAPREEAKKRRNVDGRWVLITREVLGVLDGVDHARGVGCVGGC